MGNERDDDAAERSARADVNSLSVIASSHGLTLKALLAFRENAKYRAKPGLIHPGDIVRVK